MTTAINTIVSDFVSNLETAIRAEAMANVNAALGTLTDGASNGKSSSKAKPAAVAAPTTKTGRAKPVKTKALVAARALQGKYLGALRTATGKRRTQAQAIAKKSGVPAAIKFLKAK